jgi:hypothetical protein
VIAFERSSFAGYRVHAASGVALAFVDALDHSMDF